MADAALLMGDDELAISFRGAKDPKAQVTVLANLNVCSPRKVADRLEALGLFEGTELRAEQFADHFGDPPRQRGGAPVVDILTDEVVEDAPPAPVRRRRAEGAGL